MREEPARPTRRRATRQTLLRLVFLSHATRLLSPDELSDLEASCRERNRAVGISGLLFSHGPFFFGVLEGPESRLLQRMEVIITDRRHRDMRILLEQHAPERRFLDWRLFQLPFAAGTPRGKQPSVEFILNVAQRFG